MGRRDLLGERHVRAVRGGPAGPAGLAGRLDHDVRAGSRGRCAAGEPAARPADPGRGRRRRSTGSPGTCAICPGCCGPTGRRCRARSPDADLVWIKVPASNAALAGAIAARAGVPRFVWVAGSAGDVAAGRFDGARGSVAGRSAPAMTLSGGWSVSAGDGWSSARAWSMARGSSPAWSSRPSCATRRRGPGRRPIPTRSASCGRVGWSAERGSRRCSRRSTLDRRLMLDIVGDGPDRARLRALADCIGRPQPDHVGRVT